MSSTAIASASPLHPSAATCAHQSANFISTLGPPLFAPSNPPIDPPYPARYSSSTQTTVAPVSYKSAAASQTSGLCTPPFDTIMGTTYQAPSLAAPHETHNTYFPSYGSVVPADRLRQHPAGTQMSSQAGAVSRPQQGPAVGAPAAHWHQRMSPLPAAYQEPLHSQIHAPSRVRAADPSQATTSYPQPAYVPPAKSVTPQAANVMTTARRDSSMVLHSLQIPACISPTGGNLAEFAAQLTCLFWFETPKVLAEAESVSVQASSPPTTRAGRDSIPSESFKKWSQAILSTTQVTQNVILLALLFIYRLKTTNPGVKGRSGSEYRLLTVALMLGNKFLDDNTYTNKTWAEVSGISVQEIHVMEVEFLSNMRYSLLVSKSQWDEWLEKLARFQRYCQLPFPTVAPSMPSPTDPRGTGSSVPSPNGTHTHTGTQPLAVSSAYSHSPFVATDNRQPVLPAVSPLELGPDQRSYFAKRPRAEEDLAEPAPKRVSRLPYPTAATDLGPFNHVPTPPATSMAHQAHQAPRLPAPNSAVNATACQPPAPTLNPPTTLASQATGAVSLPPLMPGSRPVPSNMYPHATPNFAPQLPAVTTSAPMVPSSTSSTVTMAPQAPPGTGAYTGTYSTPNKRLSPTSTLTPATGAYASSPLGENYSQGGVGTHTPLHHSPSVFSYRLSPYRPIRHVNTLLYPPPSASLQQYHLSANGLNPTQMHYQPIGRRNEYRTGIVPEFQINSQPIYNGNIMRGSQNLPSMRPMQGQVTQLPQAHNFYPGSEASP